MVTLLLNFTVPIFHGNWNSIYRVLGHPWSTSGHGKKGKILKAERRESKSGRWNCGPTGFQI
jgi:hypothetical protein